MTPAIRLNDITKSYDLAGEPLPVLKGISQAAPSAAFRIEGAKLARAPQRQSGRTAARANVFVHEPRATQDADSPLAFSMEGINSTHAAERPDPGKASETTVREYQSELKRTSGSLSETLSAGRGGLDLARLSTSMDLGEILRTSQPRSRSSSKKTVDGDMVEQLQSEWANRGEGAGGARRIGTT